MIDAVRLRAKLYTRSEPFLTGQEFYGQVPRFWAKVKRVCEEAQGADLDAIGLRWRVQKTKRFIRRNVPSGPGVEEINILE